MTMLEVPPVPRMPVMIAPETVLTDNPAGRLVALKLVGELVAVML